MHWKVIFFILILISSSSIISLTYAQTPDKQSNRDNGTLNVQPSAPTGLTARVVSSSQINLQWYTPSGTVDSDLPIYKIERSTDGGITWNTITTDTGPNITEWYNIGLDANTTYTYRIYAITQQGTSSPSNIASATTLNADIWYFGKGIKQNTYLKYKIRDNDVNHGNPYEMTIYFERYDNNTRYWVAPVFVITNGTILNDTFHIDPSTQFWNVFYGNTVSPEFKPYKDAFLITVDELWNFAVEPNDCCYYSYPKSLNALEWSIDPEHVVGLYGKKEITVLAGTFNCTLVEDICINKDLPYPVKGSAFELLEIGQDYPNLKLTNTTMPPLNQIAHGILPDKVTCSNDLVLLKKISGNSVACVNPQTAQKLVERGWGHLLH